MFESPLKGDTTLISDSISDDGLEMRLGALFCNCVRVQLNWHYGDAKGGKSPSGRAETWKKWAKTVCNGWYIADLAADSFLMGEIHI